VSHLWVRTVTTARAAQKIIRGHGMCGNILDGNNNVCVLETNHAPLPDQWSCSGTPAEEPFTEADKEWSVPYQRGLEHGRNGEAPIDVNDEYLAGYWAGLNEWAP
jgi:hypothetical protein